MSAGLARPPAPGAGPVTLRAARGARGMPGAGAAVAMAVGRLWGTRVITAGSGVREAGGAGLVGWEMEAVAGTATGGGRWR